MLEADHFGKIRERKKHIMKTYMKNFRGSQGGVWEEGFGARILYAGVIFPAKYSAQRISGWGILRV